MTDKFTPELWLTTTPSEDMIRAKEGFSLPGAIALVKQLRLPGAHATAPKLLDLGTGLGQITQAIMEQEAAVEVIAGDKNEDMLEVVKGKKEAEGWGDNVMVQQMDAMSLPFPDDHFDYVLGSFLYFHLPDPVKGLSGMSPLPVLSVVQRLVAKLTVQRVSVPSSPAVISASRPGPTSDPGNSRNKPKPSSPPSPTPTVEAHTRMSANGYWGHPDFVRSKLEELGLLDIQIEPAMWTHGADTAIECVKTMWQLVKFKAMMAFGGPGEEARVEGWKLFENMAEVLRAKGGEGPIKVSVVALIITAREPE